MVEVNRAGLDELLSQDPEAKRVLTVLSRQTNLSCSLVPGYFSDVRPVDPSHSESRRYEALLDQLVDLGVAEQSGNAYGFSHTPAAIEALEASGVRYRPAPTFGQMVWGWLGKPFQRLFAYARH